MGKGLGIILVILFAIILIVSAVFIFLKTDLKDKFLDKKEETKAPVYKNIQLSARDSSNKQLEASYRIYNNQSVVVQEGFLKEGQIEIFKDVAENKTYVVKAWNSDYYSNSVLCNTSMDTCTVYLKKTARPYLSVMKIKDNLYSGVVFIDGEFLQEPLICAKWKNLVELNSDLQKVKMPTEIFKHYDKCFSFETSSGGKNLTHGKYFFEITTSPMPELERSFELDLVDKCEETYLEGCALTPFAEIKI